MFVGTRRAGLLIYWDFHAQASLGFIDNGPKKRKYPASGSCVDNNASLMSEVRGEWAETQITTRYNQDLQNTISEHTTHRTLKQMGSSSTRPHRVPLLSDKNRTRRIQFTPDHQNWTIEDWKNVACLMSLDFCCDIQMIESEFGVKNMKAWIILPCLNGSDCWWWCNGVGGIFSWHTSYSTNWALFKHHSLPEYCCWPCPSLYDYSVPSSDVLPAG